MIILNLIVSFIDNKGLVNVKIINETINITVVKKTENNYFISFIKKIKKILKNVWQIEKYMILLNRKINCKANNYFI